MDGSSSSSKSLVYNPSVSVCVCGFFFLLHAPSVYIHMCGFWEKIEPARAFDETTVHECVVQGFGPSTIYPKPKSHLNEREPF